MIFLYGVIVIVFGLVMGSFLSAFTYRFPRGISFCKGRSICPECKGKIAWYDNIPLLSFLLLGGKCRNCKKKISIRYPLIEASTASTFLLIYLTFQEASFKGEWVNLIGRWALPYFLIVAFLLIAIFVIDFENQIIPDSLVFFVFLLTTGLLFLVEDKNMYAFLFSSFVAPLFLLLLHLTTKGRGMGLGDVKLALIGGIFLSFKDLYMWFFLSFLIGALIGVILLILGRAKFGKPIAFGPFMIASFFIVLFLGEQLVEIFLPYI